MEKKRIYLSSPTMHGEEQAFINEAFATNWVAPLGPNVNALEQEMTAYMGGGHACALSAGTAAIHLALRILGIGQGDVVFAPSLTFDATCNPIVYEKGTPVFIDSEKDTWNMDPEALRKAFEKHPDAKAVIVVHLYGTPAKLNEIMAICEEHHVPLIEDAAESLFPLTEIRLLPPPAAACCYPQMKKLRRKLSSLPRRQEIRQDITSIPSLAITTV